MWSLLLFPMDAFLISWALAGDAEAALPAWVQVSGAFEQLTLLGVGMHLLAWEGIHFWAPKCSSAPYDSSDILVKAEP